MERPNENGLPTRQHRQPQVKQNPDHTANQTQRLSIASMMQSERLKLIGDLLDADDHLGEVEAVDEFFRRLDPDELRQFVRNHVPEYFEYFDGVWL